ncbi:ComEC/Rec2 family competence protein [Tateyamaria sp. SN6-1]|uniref:ComEC/Rec2 family competence protein n=1 Tax=Tateyamaria sp. SN6-1 TaxID=3092148 RepID=UPI0039F53769
MGLGARFGLMIACQRGHLFGWLPVGMAVGISIFFGLRFEPSVTVIASVAVCGIFSFLASRRVWETAGPFAVLLAMIALGFCVAALRTHMLAGPVIDWRYYGPVEGRIVGMDRSGSDAVRLTLDQVRLDRVAPQDTPVRVRISLHGDPDLGVAPTPGLRVMTTAHLSPPGGPVEPGGFDFQRHAWFARLGAVGYSRVPLVASDAAAFDLRQLVFGIRMEISYAVRAALPGDVGGFAAAVTTGDRSGISQDGLNDLRAANTAHLLAISGLHMGLLSGFVFGLLRLIFALIPPIALRWPARKLAAGGALVAATGYLALSGGNVATERAFVMVAVALCAVMVDRRALSLRGVAIAALIILTWQPEALLGPGFQMSFAATTALVAVFGMLRDQAWLRRGWGQAVFGLVISSAVAGLATAPIGAAHFNAMAQYGLLANLASVPLMGSVVVPASVLAAVLAPFGAEGIGLWIMGHGLRWILWVADFVASLGGAQRFVAGPQAAVLPLMALGALFVILWQGRSRFAGCAAVLAALAMWQVDTRPDVLVSDTGGLVGVRTDDGRALSRGKGSGFVARNWLENDGDNADQETAFARWDAPEIAVQHVHGKRAIGAFAGCAPGALVVANGDLEAPAACLVLDSEVLRATGAVAVHFEDGKARIVTARDIAGDRLWSSWRDLPAPNLTLPADADKIALQTQKTGP